MDRLFKTIMKELHTLPLQPGPDTPFHLFIYVKEISTKEFLQFWEKMESTWLLV